MSKIFVETKLCYKFARSNTVLAYGVIGNTAGFGPVVLGSSPSRPTNKLSKTPKYRGFSFLGGQKGGKKLKLVLILVWRNKEHFGAPCPSEPSNHVAGKIEHFGETKNTFGETKNTLEPKNARFGETKNTFGETKNTFGETKNTLGVSSI